ncbi:hypothetical protein BDF20DRAFT_55314 [Mycotypha africana]|uniref:uncharacterized protein n=1 Tax=Mycotypha africana TaxID=64632 RepID=UPI002300731D|nr:uncharacterized protein BDF20DRAFT_55314 [Mycotypha africana]KAI8991677.1 hypothetical protein BDF20DRAFT_55314 [Mycotypha africana]
MFPNPSLKWRFIKIDPENILHFFGHERLTRLRSESKLDYFARCFFRIFDFSALLRINDPQNLQALPSIKGRMFLNSTYTDGYTCRVSFARRRLVSTPTEQLELADFKGYEIDQFFRPVTVDPGRRDVYVSYHGGQHIRKLSTKEYYLNLALLEGLNWRISASKESELKSSKQTYRLRKLLMIWLIAIMLGICANIWISSITSTIIGRRKLNGKLSWLSGRKRYCCEHLAERLEEVQ